MTFVQCEDFGFVHLLYVGLYMITFSIICIIFGIIYEVFTEKCVFFKLYSVYNIALIFYAVDFCSK